MRTTIADYIIEKLKTLNCKYTYGIPGTSCSDFYDAVAKTEGIESIVTSSELEAGYAADGYGRYAGIGVCVVAYGVGTLSMVNAVAGALVEKVPLVVLNGGPSEKALQDQREYGVLFSHSTGREDTDHRIFKEVCLATHKVKKGDTDIQIKIDTLLDKAVTEYGPVYLEIPEDMWTYEIFASANEEVENDHPSFQGTDEFINQCILKTEGSKSPVFLLGVELLRRGMVSETLQMISSTGIPFGTSVLAKSFIEEDHPLFRGTYDTDLVEKQVRSLMENSDCLIAIGCVYGVDFGGLVKGQYQKMIHLTSSEARIGSKTFAPVDLNEFLHRFRPARRPYDGKVLQQAEDDDSAMQSNASLTHDLLFRAVDQFIRLSPENFRTVLDTCLGSFSGANLRIKGNNRYAANAVWLSIGHGTPASTGIHFATGDRPLIITGDGGFQIVAESVSTMVKHKIPAVLIIIDNSAYSIEQFLIESCHFVRHGSPLLPYVGLHQWQYDKMPELFNGGYGITVKTVNELHSALIRANSYKEGPFIITARVPSSDIPSSCMKYARDHCENRKMLARMYR